MSKSLHELFNIDPHTVREALSAMEEGTTLEKVASTYLHYSTSEVSDYYLPYSTKNDKIQVVPDGNKETHAQIIKEVKKTCGVAMRRLRSVLIGKAATVTEYEKQWGTLNTRALPRLLTTGYNRVFKQKKMGQVLKARLCILIDQSGSMAGQEINEARKAATLFGEFAWSMKIPSEILGFTTVESSAGYNRFLEATKEDQERYTRWCHLEINIYKQYHEDWKQTGHRLLNLRAKNHNLDGESVMIAANRLLLAAQPGERLILFVISDGLPEQAVYSYTPQHQKYLKTAVDKILKAGIECVGIGINTKSVELYYPNYVIINDAAQLTEAQLSKLRDLLELGQKGRLTPRKEIL